MANLEIREATTYTDKRERFDIFFPEGGGMMHGVLPTRTIAIKALFDGARRSEVAAIHKAGMNNGVPFPKFLGGLIDDLREAVKYRTCLLPGENPEDPFYVLKYSPQKPEEEKIGQIGDFCSVRDDRNCLSMCSRFQKFRAPVQVDKEFVDLIRATFFKEVTETILSGIAYNILHLTDRDPWELVANKLDYRICYKNVFPSDVSKRGKLSELIAQATVDELSQFVKRKEESLEEFNRRVNRPLVDSHDARIRLYRQDMEKLVGIHILVKVVKEDGTTEEKRTGINREEIRQTLLWYFSEKEVFEAPPFAGKYIDTEQIKKREGIAKKREDSKEAKKTKGDVAPESSKEVAEEDLSEDSISEMD